MIEDTRAEAMLLLLDIKLFVAWSANFYLSKRGKKNKRKIKVLHIFTFIVHSLRFC